MTRPLGFVCATLFAALLVAPPASGQDTAEAPAAATPELQGYCPASYLLKYQAVKGKPEFSYTYDGKLYWCASEEALDAFKKQTIKYLPQFNGLCTTAMGGKFGNWLFSDPTVFDIYEGKLYLFSSERARDVYVKDKYRYIERARIVFENEPKTPRAARSGPQKRGDAPVREAKRNPVMDLVGHQMPGIELTYADGTITSTSALRDPATLLMFYASWCPACKKSLPKVEALTQDPALTGSRVLCVSMDRLIENGASGRRAVSRDQVIRQFADLGVKLPQAFVDPVMAQALLNVRSYPTFMLMDKTGQVARAWVGARGLSDGTVSNDMKTLLAGLQLPKPADGTSKSSDAPRDALRLTGRPAPGDAAFVSAFDGSKLRLPDSSDGKASVMMFYKSHCKFSNQALPMINEWVKAYDGKPVQFYGVTQDIIRDYYSDMDDRIITRDDAVDHWKELELKFPLLLDPERHGRDKFLVKSYPTVFLINPGGQVEKVYLGLKPIREGEVRAALDALLARG